MNATVVGHINSFTSKNLITISHIQVIQGLKYGGHLLDCWTLILTSNYKKIQMY